MKKMMLLLAVLWCLPAGATTIKRGPGGSGSASYQAATDCATVTTAPTGSFCQDLDSNALYVCEVGPCSGTNAWSAYVSAGGLASTDIDTSLEIKNIVTDETGSGALVFANTPTLVSPILGTPTSGVMTNVTGTAAGLTAGLATALAANGANCTAGNYPLGVDASGAVENCTAASGSGDALVANPLSQFAATTSLQLKNTISDETGSGLLTFATSPTLTTPVMATINFTDSIAVNLDTDNNSGSTFTINNGTPAAALTVTEGGIMTMTGNLLFNSTASPSMSTGGASVFDNDAWAASHGTIALHDGTAITNVVATTATDTPTNGQVPQWNTGGTITWESPSGGSAFSAITGSTNTTAAMLVGSGASLGPTGTGTVTGTSLEAGETGTLNNVSYDGTTDSWWVDVNAGGTVSVGEQLAFPDRKVIWATTTTAGGLATALTACGTDPCDIRLLPTTYSDVCFPIISKDAGIRLIGVPGKTIFKPYADLDSCTATSNTQMVEINGSDNVEITGITFDGDKDNDTQDTCMDSGDVGFHPECGIAIFINSPGNAISKNFWIHDNTFVDLLSGAIEVTHGSFGVIERNNISEIGCHQTTDSVGDTLCGDGVGAGNGGWTAAETIASTTGLKSKGIGIVASTVRAHNILIRDNYVSNASYTGIESYSSGVADCGDDPDNCTANIDIINNEVTLAGQGIVVNGGAYIRVLQNLTHGNRRTGNTGQNGVGILTGGASAAHLVFANNQVYENAGPGVLIGMSDGGDVTIAGNNISGNCTDHESGIGGALEIESLGVGELARGLRVTDNDILANTGCTYAMASYYRGSPLLGFEGNIEFRGGIFDDSVIIENANALVDGLQITGDLLLSQFATNLDVRNNIISGALTANSAATGILRGNTVSGSTTAAGMVTQTMTAATMAITGALTATSLTASPSATPTVALRDSGTTDSEDNVRLWADCPTNTGSNVEDCNVTLDQYVDGGVKNAFSSAGDGAGVIGSDQNTAWTLVTASGTNTFPLATDTLVGKATTDTLTNKTLTSPAFGGTATGANTIPSSLITTEVRSMWFGASGASVDGTQCATPAEVTINSGPKQYTVICTDNDSSTIYGSVKMPDSWDGGTVTFEQVYIQTAADTSALNGDIAAQCHGNGETVDSTYGTEIAIDDAAVTGSNKNDFTTSAAVTPAGTCAAGDMLYWRWQLDATGTTTAVATLHTLGFKMEYTSNVGD